MKKIICLLIVLVMCLSIAAPAFAVENSFVPSITYKPNPETVPVKGENGEEYIGVIRNENGEIVDYVSHDCLVITPIAHIWDEEIEIPEAVEKLLTEVYEALTDGSMNIPYEKHNANLDPANMVIRDLFDARWSCEEHRAMVEKEGYTFEITFELGAVADAQIFVMTYDEASNEWSPIVKAVNNGDGTVTCTFEHLCVVEFSMSVPGSSVPTDTPQTFNLLPWILILVLAVLGLVLVLVLKKKKSAN